VDAVRANHFHVLGDLVRSHLVSPLVSPIALKLGVLRQAEPGELQPRVRRPAVHASLPCCVVSDLAGAARILAHAVRLRPPQATDTAVASGGVPTRQLPMRADEVAGVAVRIAFQVFLVLGFRLPEIANGRELGHDLARPQP
jgi:hypothetical protein